MYFNRDRYLHVFILIVMLQYSTLKAVIVTQGEIIKNNNMSTIIIATIGLQPEGTRCACAGDMLIYNCSIMGGFTTLWKGTAFDCPLDDCEITLRHSQFAANQEIGICNNGDIEGRSIGVANDCYTSQLNMIVRESFNNKTVQCASVSHVGTRFIGESLLSVPSATNSYPPPDNIYLADAQPGKLVFSWTPVISNCSMLLQYSITSECGTCPTITNATTATCSDVQLTTNVSLCNFRVSSRACDLTGNPSSPTVVTLKVPDDPQVEIVPRYSYDSQTLERLYITTNHTVQDLFYISDNISGSPISYSAYGFNNSINGSAFNSTVSVSDYEKGSGYPIELPPSYCSQSAIINITISAANKLGEGPRSNPFMIECTNNFVQVVYSETTAELTITCVFLNSSDTSEKTCCITHRICDQKGPANAQVCNRNSPYNIQLEVSSHSSQRYCYTVTASNDTYTIRVDGTFISGDRNSGGSTTTAVAIAGGVIVLFILVLLLVGTIVWIVIRVNRIHKLSQKRGGKGSITLDFPPPNLLKQHLTPYPLPNTFKLHYVKGDSELQELITGTLSVEFRRGHTCYEFTNKVENILEGMDVLLQDTKTKEWFRLAPPEEIATGRFKWYGEGVARSSFGDRYTVFIQSFGSGARHLPHGSSILYDHSKDQENLVRDDHAPTDGHPNGSAVATSNSTV